MNSQDTTIGCMMVQSVWIGCLLPPNGCYLPSRALQTARQLPNRCSLFLVSGTSMSAEESHEPCSTLELSTSYWALKIT